MLFRPLPTTVSPTATERRSLVIDDLERRGRAIEDEGWASVTRTGSSLTPDVDAPLAILSLDNPRPLTVVSAVANAAHEGYVPVLVTDERTATEMEPVLSEPFLLRGRSSSGRRFFAIEDRILLSDDSYACVGTGGRIRWREDEGTLDDPPIVLEGDDEVVAALDSVDALTCPGPSASTFRYSYTRKPKGHFSVLENGAEYRRYPSVSAMRTDGFRPVPLPLVPEHHIRENGHLARAVVVATVGSDGAVTYQAAV